MAPILEENFDNELSEQWELWGNTDNITTTLIIEGNDSDTFLLLSSQDVTADGISSLAEDIPFEAGVVISFTANLTTPAIDDRFTHPALCLDAWNGHPPGAGS